MASVNYEEMRLNAIGKSLRGGDGQQEWATALLVIDPDKGTEANGERAPRRECWLVRRSEKAEALLSAAIRKTRESGDSAFWFWVELNRGPSSNLPQATLEAARACGLRGALCFLDRSERLSLIWQALSELAAIGLALGPADLGEQTDTVFFKMDAALACAALKDGLALEKACGPAREGPIRSRL